MVMDLENKKHPSKGEATRSKYGEDILRMQHTTTYPSVQVDITILNQKTMLVQHKRTYEVVNISNEPIYQVLHGIATDVEKYSLNDLNVQVYDENHREMKISSINVDKPTSKEFTTVFNRPILKGEDNRKYVLVYEVEEPERYFENAFLIDVKKFVFNFKYPSNNCDFKPVVYDINQETEVKTKSKNQSKIENIGDYNVARYTRTENVKGETIRIEW